MKITITAILSDEQALILAKEKGYSETISVFTPTEGAQPNEMGVVPWVTAEVENTESPFEFLKRVYESLIISDAQKHYLERDNRLYAEARKIEEQAIRDSVVASVSSKVE